MRLFIFFIFYELCIWFHTKKKPLPNIKAQIFSLKSFVIVDFTFNSTIFWGQFCINCKRWIITDVFTQLWNNNIQLVQHELIKHFPFSTELPLFLKKKKKKTNS